jgi:hypothetical protein
MISNCHAPRKRGIQYTAKLRFYLTRQCLLGHPVKPGGDKWAFCGTNPDRIDFMPWL